MINLCDEPEWSFEELRSLNAAVVFSHYDYARVLRQSGKISYEVLINWLTTYQPSFTVFNEKVFVEEMFSIERYTSLLTNGSSEDAAQLFINLVSINSIIGDGFDGSIKTIAKNVADKWNSRLLIENLNSTDRARVIYEKNDEEYFVTIDGVV